MGLTLHLLNLQPLDLKLRGRGAGRGGLSEIPGSGAWQSVFVGLRRDVLPSGPLGFGEIGFVWLGFGGLGILRFSSRSFGVWGSGHE